MMPYGNGSAIQREISIGSARLILGDSREILPQMGQVGAIVTDPPYGMAFQSNYRRRRYAKIASDNSTDALWLARYVPVTHSRYIFCRWDNLRDMPAPTSVITWVKNNWSMGDLEHEHARQTELILFYPGPEHRFPSGRPRDVVMIDRTSNAEHPTEKPVALMEIVINWTEGLVVDPFMGSGSTGVACVHLDRPFVGIEIDETHFDAACQRLEKAQGRPKLFRPADVPIWTQQDFF